MGRFAASDFAGTRLFHLNIEELEVRSEKALPAEVRKTAASALLFFGAGSLLAMACWGSGELMILDTSRLVVSARLAQHKAQVSHLAAKGEWLTSCDVEGGTHVFNVDTLSHHARVPVGSSTGFPTALGFDARGKRLIVVLSSHEVVVFDVEAQALVANVPSPSRIPVKLLQPQKRLSGVVASLGRPDKVLLWGHQSLISMDLRPEAQAPAVDAEEAPGGAPTPKKKAKKNKKGAQTPKKTDDVQDAKEPAAVVCGEAPFQSFEGMKNVLAMAGLDEARWGGPILQGYCLQDSSATNAAEKKEKSKKRKSIGSAVGALVLSLEVAPEAAEKSLPQPFERKQFVSNFKQK